MLSEQVHTFEQHDVGVLICSGTLYFRASDVVSLFGYKNVSKTIRAHVQDEHIKTLMELTQHVASFVMRSSDAVGKSPLYVSFGGLLQLLQNVKSPKVDSFKEWLLSQTMPELLRTGCVSDETATQHYRAYIAAGLDSFAHVSLHNSEPVEGDALYVMVNPLLPNMVKIGRSICPEARAKELSKSQPFQIAVCYQYNDYGFLERLLHGRVSKTCVVGGRGREWFAITPTQADLMIRAAILEHQLQN
jgi:prophage antirepressor-like protein